MKYYISFPVKNYQFKNILAAIFYLYFS